VFRKASPTKQTKPGVCQKKDYSRQRIQLMERHPGRRGLNGHFQETKEETQLGEARVVSRGPLQKALIGTSSFLLRALENVLSRKVVLLDFHI
jgi:hypothetical protein